jgi:hypothetical protein
MYFIIKYQTILFFIKLYYGRTKKGPKPLLLFDRDRFG